jgi:hypothetical protein
VSNLEKDYYIKIPHFYSFEYYEGDKKMVIELDFRDQYLYLTPTLITKWQEPYENLNISFEDKLRILHSIQECLINEGWKIEEVIIVEESERT